MVADGAEFRGGSRKRFSQSEGMITYKRRLCARPEDLPRPCRASAPEREDREGFPIPVSCEQDRQARICRHWRMILEHMLCSLDGGHGSSITSCIRKALSANPFDSASKFKMDNNVGLCQFVPHSGGTMISNEVLCDRTRLGITDQTNNSMDRTKCQSILFDVLLSQKFALLCDLLGGNFHENVAKEMLDFHSIDSKMQDGVYENSSEQFGKDIVQVWEKFRKVGEQMSCLASSLIAISLASYTKQVGDDLVVHQAAEKKCEEEKISMGSCTTSRLASCESDRSNRIDAEASCLQKVRACLLCGNKADEKNSLICDGCDAMFHLSCVEEPMPSIPTQNWFCSLCRPRHESGLPVQKIEARDGLHPDCVVCDTLGISEPIKKEASNTSGKDLAFPNDRESSDSSMESDEPLEPSRTAKLRLCKYCGAPEDGDKRFVICDHGQCLYKYYHLRCMKRSKLALQQQEKRPCWYCPSCLCRACFSDEDDEKIVLCDGCDEAFHTYCMNPPLASVPKGDWYCNDCNAKRAKEAIRLYEQSILQNLGKRLGKPNKQLFQ